MVSLDVRGRGSEPRTDEVVGVTTAHPVDAPNPVLLVGEASPISSRLCPALRMSRARYSLMYARSSSPTLGSGSRPGRGRSSGTGGHLRPCLGLDPLLELQVPRQTVVRAVVG